MAKAKILVVGNESLGKSDLKSRLIRLGYSAPGVVSSGAEALRRISEIGPDLVLMDISLKGEMDGIEAARQIRDRFDVPVIYLAADADENALERAKITEPMSYVRQPFAERELQVAIAIALSQHQIEEKLKNREQWLAGTRESIGDAVIVTDAQGHIQFMNPMAASLTGWRQEEAWGRNLTNVLQVMDEETGKQIKNPAKRVLQENLILPMANHSILLAKNGKKIPIEGHGAPIKDQRGNPTGVVLAFRDITERKPAEEALRDKEAFNFALFEYNPVQTIVVDLEGRIVKFNLAIREANGRLPKIGDVMYQDYAGKHAIDMYGELMECIKSGKTKIFPGQKYGDRVLSITISPFLKGAIITSEDITHRKRAEEALRESEEKYRILVDHANEAIFIAQDGVVKFPNPSTLALIGYSTEELAQTPFVNLIHPEDRQMVWENHQKRLRGEDLPHIYSFRVLNRSGEELWVQLSTVLTTWEGRPATLNYLRDVTPLKKLELQFQQAQKMEAIGTLAGGIAHDFNNLLMGIQGYISLMLFNMDSTHPHHENLKKIEEHVRSGASLTSQLLGFARRGKYEVKPTDLNQIIQRSSEMFERTKKEIKIYRKYQEDTWIVEVDRGQIEQLLLNLYVNAWQAMAEGGSLYLETKNVTLSKEYIKPFWVQPGDYVKISVTDTGMGMDEKTKQRIFEPFFTTKGMGRGTGLGLASAYGIVKNHGGFINVYSEKGQGTTFTIYLPVTGKELKEEKKVLSAELLRGTETILLVDDEDTIINVVEKALNLLGYRVLIARGGEEAAEIYRENQQEIALVILDMIMPGIGGGEAYDLLKEINPHVKAILSSGYSFNGEAAHIIAMGCDGFIQKPFGIKELSKKIREILDKTQGELGGK
ncbi:MAG: PAS domain S-box protein [Deltaproteobacteria bacterium]|nr:PAS domain S-box protein [Deltaproteobacteria bacterium]